MRGESKRLAPNEQEMAHTVSVLVVAGDEGNANVGDQSMFVGLVDRVKRAFARCQITSMSRHPENVLNVAGVTRYYGAYDYLSGERGFIARIIERLLVHGSRLVFAWRVLLLFLAATLKKIGIKPLFVSSSARKLLGVIQGADIVVSCGGGYLNSVFRWDCLWPYCALYRLAALMGRPVILTGQGIGPITSRIDRIVLKWGLKHVAFIGLRDSGEGDAYLKSLGIKCKRIESLGDDAVDVENCTLEQLESAKIAENIPSGKPIVVAQFRPTSHTKEYSKEYLQAARAIDCLIERLGCHVLFVPIMYADNCDDRHGAFGIVMHMKHKNDTTIVVGKYPPAVIRALIGLGVMAIGGSYHFGLFALTQGVPFMGLYDNEYYRLKFEGLLGHFGSPEWLFSFDNLDPSAIGDQACEILADSSVIKASLIAYMSEMSKRVDTVTGVMSQCLK